MLTQKQPPTRVQPVERSPAMFANELAVLYIRSIKKLIRRPVLLYFSLIQPVLWLILFGQIFSRLTRFPDIAGALGHTSYFQFFMPAVILQIVLVGSVQSGLGIIDDMNKGFLDKLLTTPINRMAILLSRIFSELTRMLAQGALILVFAWAIGQFLSEKVRFVYGIPGAAGALGIALLLELGLAGFYVFIALRTRDARSTFTIANVLTLPLFFTSSAQLPLQLLPDWLQLVARVNPVTYTIGAMRILLNGPQAVAGNDPQLRIMEALALLSAIALVTLALAVRSFRRIVR